LTATTQDNALTILRHSLLRDSLESSDRRKSLTAGLQVLTHLQRTNFTTLNSKKLLGQSPRRKLNQYNQCHLHQAQSPTILHVRCSTELVEASLQLSPYCPLERTYTSSPDKQRRRSNGCASKKRDAVIGYKQRMARVTRSM